MPGMFRKSRAFVARYQRFESVSLHQRVLCEPDIFMKIRWFGRVPFTRPLCGYFVTTFHDIGGEYCTAATGMRHVASPVASRRPNSQSSRCSAFRRKLTSGITAGVMDRSRVTTSRVSAHARAPQCSAARVRVGRLTPPASRPCAGRRNR